MATVATEIWEFEGLETPGLRFAVRWLIAWYDFMVFLVKIKGGARRKEVEAVCGAVQESDNGVRVRLM